MNRATLTATARETEAHRESLRLFWKAMRTDHHYHTQEMMMTWRDQRIDKEWTSLLPSSSSTQRQAKAVHLPPLFSISEWMYPASFMRGRRTRYNSSWWAGTAAATAQTTLKHIHSLNSHHINRIRCTRARVRRAMREGVEGSKRVLVVMASAAAVSVPALPLRHTVMTNERVSRARELARRERIKKRATAQCLQAWLIACQGTGKQRMMRAQTFY